MTKLEELEATIELNRHKPFIWAEHNCCTFVCDYVFRRTGTDVFPRLTKLGVMSRRGALNVMGQQGGMIRAASKFLPLAGCTRLRLLHFAERGDVVIARTTIGMILGLCVGTRFVTTGKNGVDTMSMNDVVAAWRVP